MLVNIYKNYKTCLSIIQVYNKIHSKPLSEASTSVNSLGVLLSSQSKERYKYFTSRADMMAFSNSNDE